MLGSFQRFLDLFVHPRRRVSDVAMDGIGTHVLSGLIIDIAALDAAIRPLNKRVKRPLFRNFQW